MSDDPNFRKATRRLLFKPNLVEQIPGGGTSAAEESDRHLKVRVTMNIDGDVVRSFKKMAELESRPYQSLINQVLRDYMLGSRPERLAKQVMELLLEDENFLKDLAHKLKAQVQ